MHPHLYISTFMVGYVSAASRANKSNTQSLVSAVIIGSIYAILLFGGKDNGVYLTGSNILSGILLTLTALKGGAFSTYIIKPHDRPRIKSDWAITRRELYLLSRMIGSSGFIQSII